MDGFAQVGIELEFKGEGVEEKGFVKHIDEEKYQAALNESGPRKVNNSKCPEIGKEVLAVDPKYFRPTEVDLLIGDPSKAKQKLGWECKYDLQDLVKDMMKSDVKLMQKDQFLKDNGFATLNYFE